MRKALLVVVLAMLAGIAVFAIMSRGSEASVRLKDGKKINQIALAFVRDPYEDDYQIARITGYVENRGSAKILVADLSIQLVDKDGNKKELVKYRVRDIPAYSRKSFDANAGGLTPGSRKSTVKITSLEVVR